jgi:hypothetical protein
MIWYVRPHIPRLYADDWNPVWDAWAKRVESKEYIILEISSETKNRLPSIVKS